MLTFPSAFFLYIAHFGVCLVFVVYVHEHCGVVGFDARGGVVVRCGACCDRNDDGGLDG